MPPERPRVARWRWPRVPPKSELSAQYIPLKECVNPSAREIFGLPFRCSRSQESIPTVCNRNAMMNGRLGPGLQKELLKVNSP